MRELFLIGARGSGKSSAGVRAAEHLGASFVDTDALIELDSGLPIPEIFATRGEAHFRRLEAALITELLDRPTARIVATGGGVVLDQEVAARLQEHRGVVWLRAEGDVLASRIAGSDRPSLSGEAPEAEIHRILEQRSALYHRCASFEIDTTARSVDEVAHELEQLWHAL